MRALDFLIAGLSAELVTQLVACAYLFARGQVGFDRYAAVAAVVLMLGGSIVGALAGLVFARLGRRLPGAPMVKATVWFALVGIAFQLGFARHSTVEEIVVSVVFAIASGFGFALLARRLGQRESAA